MSNVKGFGDLAVYTLDAASQLTIAKNVAYELENMDADTTIITRYGKRRQTVKKGVTIRSGFMSTLSGDSGLVASNLAVTAFSIGGQSYLDKLRGGNLRGSYDVREVSGVADPFRWPQIFGKDYAMEVTILLPAAGAAQTDDVIRNLMTDLHDVSLLDQDLTRRTVTIGIDSVAHTLDMHIGNIRHEINQNQEQVVTLSMSGVDPGTGNYPAAPTGTTTLLENFFNDFNTALAVVLTTGAAASGETYGGNFIPTDFGFSFNDSEIIMIDYTLQSRGTVTAATA